MQTDQETPEQAADMSEQTGDPVWDKLMKLPFFQSAHMDQKREMYERRVREERDSESERRRFEAEREIRLREISAERSRDQTRSVPQQSLKLQIPAWSNSTRADKFFTTCEKLFEAANLPKESWVGQVVEKLSERARNVYATLPSDIANNYDSLKREILAEYHVSPTVYRKNFFSWIKRPHQTYSEYIKELREQLALWTAGCDPNTIDWPELLLKFRFDSQLPEDLSLFILDKKAATLNDCVSLADEYMLNRKMLSKTRPDPTDKMTRRPNHPPANVSKETPRSNGSNQNRNHVRSAPNTYQTRPQKFCSYCQRRGHENLECWSNPASEKFRGNRQSVRARSPTVPNPSPSSAFCTPMQQTTANEPVNPLLAKYTGYASVGTPDMSTAHTKVTYLRDSGSTISLLTARADLEHAIHYTGEKVIIRGVNHIPGNYPLATVNIESDVYTGNLTVAVLNHRAAAGIDLIIGNEIDEISAGSDIITCGVVTRSKSRQTDDSCPIQPQPWETTAESSAQDTPGEDQPSENDIESQGSIPDQPHEMCGENLQPSVMLTDQENDPTLAPLWEMAGQDAETNSGFYIHDKTKLLMRRDRPNGKKSQRVWTSKDQIVLPRKYRDQVLQTAHNDMTSGHQGSKKTLERITRKFFWPGIRAQVKHFCKSCGPCQRANRNPKVRVAPLKPLPVIRQPFSFISADFVGPLPETPDGNRYILNIIDHATKYVESYPFRTADAQTAEKAITDVISRHGKPETLLTDRGSYFVSESFTTFLSENGVRHLTSSAYYAQTNGQIEKFNGTQKTMLKILSENSDRPWDTMLPWLLFAYRSARHDTTGFSPFFLLYGREPRDNLDIAYDRWAGIEPTEEMPCDKYTHDLVATLRRALSEAHASAEHAASDRKRRYDRSKKALLREFQPGQMVLVRLPQVGKQLRNPLQGPYPIHAKVGTHTYLVNTPDKRQKIRVMHVNQLQKWTGREQQVVTVECCPMDESIGSVLPQYLEPTEIELECDPCNHCLSESIPSPGWPDISHLTPEQQSDVIELFKKHSVLFSGKLGCIQGIEHDIDVQGASPIRQSYYRTSPEKMAILKTEIDRMLSAGVIRKSQSAWASPIILVRKADQSWRPCIDYRRVNAVTRPESYPIPRLDTLIDRVASANVISKLDMKSSFWQIQMTRRASEIAAFITPWGSFEPVTLPFGCRNAPATFQRAMNTILTENSDNSNPHCADAYLDDISVTSDSWDQHLSHLDWVFGRLETAGATLNASKCHIGSGTVQYLGHQIGSGKVCPVTAKVQAICKIAPPTTKKHLRSFLGTVGFYRRFIPRFSEMAAPLTDLLRGQRKGALEQKWNEQHQRAFDSLKKALSSQPVLAAPDFSRPFELYTDASMFGVGSVLVQEKDGVPHPIAFYSKKLEKRQQAWSTIEIELLAIVTAIKEFQVYIGTGPVKIRSDHNPLVWLQSARSSNQRLLRWSLYLSEYNLEIQHIKGKDNLIADFLSRSSY